MANRVGKGLVAKKVGMTRMYDANGAMVPVTVLKIEDQRVTKILNSERDGYSGYQVGYFEKSEKNLTLADRKRLRNVSVEDNFARFCEFRTNEPVADLELGAKLGADLFKECVSIDVTGVTKGRGYQGSVKRWGSAIGRMTHGSRFHRRPGSLGSNTTPGRVFKNKKQPGQYGNDVCTLTNLSVVKVDETKNIVVIKGSIPGHSNGYVRIRPTNRA